jgi:hypothetical protein
VTARGAQTHPFHQLQCFQVDFERAPEHLEGEARILAERVQGRPARLCHRRGRWGNGAATAPRDVLTGRSDSYATRAINKRTRSARWNAVLSSIPTMPITSHVTHGFPQSMCMGVRPSCDGQEKGGAVRCQIAPRARVSRLRARTLVGSISFNLAGASSGLPRSLRSSSIGTGWRRHASKRAKASGGACVYAMTRRRSARSWARGSAQESARRPGSVLARRCPARNNVDDERRRYGRTFVET